MNLTDYEDTFGLCVQGHSSGLRKLGNGKCGIYRFLRNVRRGLLILFVYLHLKVKK